MADIKTIDDLIDALGGDSVLADALGISQPAVAMWKQRGNIAASWHLRLLVMLKRKGLSVSPEVFGLTADEGRDLLGQVRKPHRGNGVAASA